MAISFYKISPAEDLKTQYIGKHISELPTPSALIDVAKVRNNCKLMLDAVQQLGLTFRAHVKTHKTSELTQLQVGRNSKDVRLVVSTVIEAEQLVPLLQQYQAKGAKVNVLYGLPLSPSLVTRLANVARQLGAGSVATMVDNVVQLPALQNFQELAGFPIGVFIKADSGGHRAGLDPKTTEMGALVAEVSSWEKQGIVQLLGFYSHNSVSYGGSSPDEAMHMLKVEIDACLEASKHIRENRNPPLRIAVGASPTALSIQNVLSNSTESDTESTFAKELRNVLNLTKENLELELHAGVYPIFDLQQVAAQSRTFTADPHDSIAATVLAEVCSEYPNRMDTPEALISAGCLAFAREPCKSYPGHGVVSPWGMPADYNISPDKRIVVSRVSQEHGILAYERAEKGQYQKLPVYYGQKLRIWPNHACITLAMFDWYFVVDSEVGDGDLVSDVWVRWRGW